jgi:hypothetical protein
MKGYNIIISNVKRLLGYHPKYYAMGYIYALLDWRMINQETYEKLKIFIEKGKNYVDK